MKLSFPFSDDKMFIIHRYSKLVYLFVYRLDALKWRLFVMISLYIC